MLCMHPSFLSVLPFLSIIPIALLTKQVIPGLVVGWLLGAALIARGFIPTLDTALVYLYKEASVPGNLHLIVFLYAFGAFVGLIQITGGVSGFARLLRPRIHSAKGAFAVTWLSSFATFMAPDFRIITVAPAMKPVTERFGISTDRLAYAVNVTSTPLISVVPVATAFVGYMLGLVAVGLKHIGNHASPFGFFLSTLPFNLFAWAILLVGAYLSFVRKAPALAGTATDSAGAQGAQGASARVAGNAAAPGAHAQTTGAQGLTKGAAQPRAADEAEPSALHLLLPIALLIVLTLAFTWISGAAKASTPLGILVNADATKAMLEAIVVTLVLSSLFYLLRKQPVGRLMTGIIEGGNEMVPVILLLTLVWAVSGLSAALGFTPYVAGLIGHSVPRLLIAPALFVIGSLISYFIGSSFGAWAMLIPLAFTLAQASGSSLPVAVGAVFASGTLGGFASPLSDNTIAMATVLKLPAVDFARSLLKTTVVAGAAATVGYAVLGFVGV